MIYVGYKTSNIIEYLDPLIINHYDEDLLIVFSMRFFSTFGRTFKYT